VRRHPDIRLQRRVSDVSEFAKKQSELLDALWRVLAPGGKLLYATCSVFPEENSAQTDAFLGRHPDASLLSPFGVTRGDGRGKGEESPRSRFASSREGQFLTCEESDGFYYALLEKQSGGRLERSANGHS
jgi:16S rRNA (cytosine967-C5)-methyltransferase